MSSESIERFDQSGLKAACERGLKIGRTRQEFDLQLLLDMLTRIEGLETDALDHQRIVKELEVRLQVRPVSELASKLSNVLGYLHVINSDATLLVNFPDDPHLRPKERGEKIQQYRLSAHQVICEVIDGIRAQPPLSDAIREVEKARAEYNVLRVRAREEGEPNASEVEGKFSAADDLLSRLRSLSTQEGKVDD